jgi:hypothetical protein
MRKVILVFAVVMFLAGCQNEVTFDKPQPPDTSHIHSFPDRIQGHYQHPEDLQSLYISDKMVTAPYDNTDRYSKNGLDSAQYLSGDTLINKTTGQRELAVVTGDSIIVHHQGIDTLFAVSSQGVLKKFKGYFFLNRQLASSYWEVYRLSLDKNMLVIGHITDSTDIALLKELSENTHDSTGYVFHPTQKQFNAYLKRDGFKNRDTFMRVQ